ncbi:MAG: hypothetical protein K1X89_07640 [Myxococcaceae bacterium]|nr:hypothetical protein [Myxococcaceae bacterium]
MRRATLVTLFALAACKSTVNVEEGRAYSCTDDSECLSGWSCGEDGVCFDPERRAEGATCRARRDCPSDKPRPVEVWKCVTPPGASEGSYDGTCQQIDAARSHVCYSDGDCAVARQFRCNLSTLRCVQDDVAKETRPAATFSVGLLSPGVLGPPRAVALSVGNDRRHAFAWLGDDVLALTYEERAALQVAVDGGDVSELAMSSIGAVLLRKNGTLRLETGLPDAGGVDLPTPPQGSHLRALGPEVVVLTPSGARTILGAPLWDAGTHCISADDVADIARVRPANMRGERYLIIDRNGGLGLDMNSNSPVEASLRYAQLPSNVSHHAGCQTGAVGDGGTYTVARVLLPTIDTGATSSVVLLSRDGAEPAYAMMVSSLDRGSGGPTNECNTVQYSICSICPDGSAPSTVVPLASYESNTGPGLLAACKGTSGEQRTFQLQFNGSGQGFEQCRRVVVVDPSVSQGVSGAPISSLANPESTVTAAAGGQLYVPEGYVNASGEGFASMRPLMLDEAPALIVRGPTGTPYQGIIAGTSSRFFSYYPGAGLISNSQTQGDEHVVAFAVSDPTVVITNLHVFDLTHVDYGADSPRPIAGFGGQTATISSPFSADLIEVADAGLLVVASNDRLFAADVKAQRAAVDPIAGALLTPRLSPVPGIPIASFAVAAPVVATADGMGSAYKTDLIGFALAGAELVQFSMNVDDLSWYPEPLSVENLVGTPVEVFGDGVGPQRRAFIAFDRGQIYTLPNRTEVGALLPKDEVAHDFVRLCGRTLALTDNGVFQLAASGWVKLPGLPAVDGAYVGAKLYAGNGEVFLVLVNGYTFLIGSGTCQ